MKPQRIQLSRAKGWRMPPDTVIVARPTYWGNPWHVWQDENDDYKWLVSDGPVNYEVRDKKAGIELAVKLHAEHERKIAASYGGATRLSQLRGKNLACWCPLDSPCHADVLLELANG